MVVAVAVAVNGGVAVPVAVPMAVPVAGLTKKSFNQKDFLINVWGSLVPCALLNSTCQDSDCSGD